MRKPFLLSLLVALLTTIATHAYDFQSDDLYYNITSDNTVEVTYQEYSSSTNYQGLTTATIPATVTYNGTTYSVTSIGREAFENCSSFTSITLPNSVTSIGYDAFYKCSSLTSITIPNSVTSIGSSAFNSCSSLTSITLPNSVTSIGSSAFSGCSSLPVKDNLRYADTYLVEAVDRSLSTYTIKAGTKWIGSSAFWYCRSLTSITLPNSVTSIGNYAFSNCSSLTSITIPDSVTSIGEYAFNGCTSLPVEDNLRYADTYLVEAVDKSLSTYTIKAGTKWIGYRAFMDCSSLTSIILPNSVTSIGGFAFYGCSALTSITLPNSVTSIGGYAFEYCTSLTSITIPNSVTSIGSSAFEGCSSLTSITIPNSVTSIGNYAFYKCSALTSITIPNSVTSIGGSAFRECSSLTSITCLATTPPTCVWYSFDGVPRTIPLYVPAESVEAYKSADTWKEFDVQALLSTDATLSSLTYDGMLVPSFDAGTLYYTVDLPSETVDVPVVDAVANDSDATLTIHQAAALPGEASVEVLAADKTTRLIYTIYFSKKSTPTDISDRPDATGTDSDKGAEKLLRNGQVLIIRNGKTYNMMGQRL